MLGRKAKAATLRTREGRVGSDGRKPGIRKPGDLPAPCTPDPGGAPPQRPGWVHRATETLAMTIAANLGFPRIGPKRELKTALEAFWSGRLDEPGLLAAASRCAAGA